MLKKALKLFFQNKLRFLVIILGSISWIVTVFKSGLNYPFGIGFWGANGHDGVWHIALANSLARGSLEMPTFAGETLKNYHIGFDLLLVLINRLIGIPINVLYFQIIPPILAVLIGILTYKLVISWTKPDRAALWATFFVYFGGSFGFALGKGESAFWSQQAISTLINPPFALSLIFILLGLVSLLKYQKSFSIWDLAFSILFFGVLIEIKAYAGILALGSLLVSGVWRVIREKKYDYLFVFLGSTVLSLVLFLPLNSGSGNLLVFQPFWFLETMMGLTDRVGWLKFGEAMVNYRAGGVWVKALAAYGAAFMVFLVGNLGTRLVFVKQIIGKLDNLRIFILSIILGGILIPMLFLQKGTPWNTIQFFYYSLFFSAILAGIAAADILKRLNTTIFRIIVVLGILTLTLPTSAIALKDVYLPARPPAMISRAELEALNFLAKQENGVVLTYPFDEFKAKDAISNPPRPLYLYASAAYVSAYANKPIYLEDEINLDITGYDWRGRRKKVFEFIGQTDVIEARQFLEENKIKYLYLVKKSSPLVGEELKLGSGQLGITKIFDNSEVSIYRN